MDCNPFIKSSFIKRNYLGLTVLYNRNFFAILNMWINNNAAVAQFDNKKGNYIFNFYIFLFFPLTIFSLVILLINIIAIIEVEKKVSRKSSKNHGWTILYDHWLNLFGKKEISHDPYNIVLWFSLDWLKLAHTRLRFDTTDQKKFNSFVVFKLKCAVF